jgi:hypothetical protein
MVVESTGSTLLLTIRYSKERYGAGADSNLRFYRMGFKRKGESNNGVKSLLLAFLVLFLIL